MRTRRSENHDRSALNSRGDGDARRKGVRRGNRLPRPRIEVEKLYNDGCGPTAAKHRPRFSAHFGTGRVLRMACRKVMAGCTLPARVWQSRRPAGPRLVGLHPVGPHLAAPPPVGPRPAAPHLAGRIRWGRRPVGPHLAGSRPAEPHLAEPPPVGPPTGGAAPGGVAPGRPTPTFGALAFCATLFGQKERGPQRQISPLALQKAFLISVFAGVSARRGSSVRRMTTLNVSSWCLGPLWDHLGQEI